MIRPLTMEIYNDFLRRYPNPEKWDEDAVYEAQKKYDELFDKYFPMTYYRGDGEYPEELKDVPMLGTILLWHTIMDCVERGEEYEISPRIRELEKDPNVCGVYG